MVSFCQSIKLCKLSDTESSPIMLASKNVFHFIQVLSPNRTQVQRYHIVFMNLNTGRQSTTEVSGQFCFI